MRTLVIGCGAIGSLIAGILSQKGFQVDLACKNADQAERLAIDGLIFKIKNRRYIQFVKAYNGVIATPGNYDYVLLATKSFEIEQPVNDVLTKLSPQGLIISLQDGYCEQIIARVAGSDRVVGAMVGWGATMLNNGMSEMSSKGDMLIGKLDGSDDPRLDNLQYMLNHIVPTSIVRNINEQIYSKLIINSCVTTLGAITGLKVGALITDKKLRNTFIQIIKEALLVADLLKIEIPDYAGKLNYYRLIRGHSLFHRIRKHIKIRLFGFRFRKVKSSGLQSLERGEATETDFLNGYIVQRAKELGIETPVNQRLVSLVHEIENGQRKITPQNLNDPLFGVR
ncbi:MAG TPA: 2-dehydropantoate 2-reductase [Prolixibacteraceae bacterium]|nr:2-dehydropantoate 2-reductase [Prolixibacteraceae bacterium]HPR59805.1 2-dehydropantoate 2-reductase [Prolixibacteraceae bacterium]